MISARRVAIAGSGSPRRANGRVPAAVHAAIAPESGPGTGAHGLASKIFRNYGYLIEKQGAT
jgi:hypothetical protein